MKPIRIYTSPGCVWCERAKQFLKQKKVKFKDINAARTRQSADELFAKTGQTGVPVFEIDNSVIVGFDQGLLEAALRISGRIK